ncbi:hypothetical protein AB0K74_16405, partial [Streptomyces sp. NPDC056159]|uniref:hypothetical protein n=1 Tax=Streptomyces sp. NPDC056159 TaxID=3155537 RepID=UPI00342E9515
SETQPGTATLALDNDDGRFTPGNSSSPYYPFVLRGIAVESVRRLRVLDPLNGFTTGQADHRGDHAENVSVREVEAEAGRQAEESDRQGVNPGRMSLNELH